MSRNTETVNRYLDGFRRNDHAQILSCLTDEIQWTVFGAFRLSGREAYDRAIDGAPEFMDPPELEVVRMVEQGDVIMAELTGVARRAAGGEVRMSMAEWGTVLASPRLRSGAGLRRPRRGHPVYRAAS